MSESFDTFDLDASTRQRGISKAKLTRTETSVAGLIKKDTPDFYDLQIRIQKLEALYSEFHDIHDKIEFYAEKEEVQKQLDEGFEFDEKFYKIMAELKNLQIKAPNNASARQTSTSSQNANQPKATIKLPKLDLPVFTGNYTEWTSFYDLFRSIIHRNATLTGSQKLQYLKSSLKGEASKLLSNVQITDANYNDAWDSLVNRYENKRFIVKHQIKSLMSVPALLSENATALRKLLDHTMEVVRALKVLGVPVDTWDIILIHIISEKLDIESKRLWELNQSNGNFASFVDFTKFLENRHRSLEASLSVSKRPTAIAQSSRPTLSSHLSASTTSRKKCNICSSDHWTNHCPQLKSTNVQERINLAKKMKLCLSCLNVGHELKNCKAGRKCYHCGKSHHGLLCLTGAKDQSGNKNKPVESNLCNSNDIGHNSSTSSSLQQNTEKSFSTEDNTHQVLVAENTKVSTSLVSESKLQQVLLSTALAKVKDRFGNYKICRVLLDSGSQANFISEKCLNKLGLNRRKTQTAINGIGQVSSGDSYSSVDFNIENLQENYLHQITSLVLPKITGKMPSESFTPQKKWSHLMNITLADPNYFKSTEIDILLGGECFYDLLLDGKLVGPPGSPTAQNTVFGWLLGGKVNSARNISSIASHHVTCSMDVDLKKFWEIENQIEKPLYTKEELQAEGHFVSTHSRDTTTGRYTVQLPFKQDAQQLGESRTMALVRFKLLENRFIKNPEIQQRYIDFMEEYIKLGHMEKIPANELFKPCSQAYYIPHHVVIKENSTSTKYRVVFDASAKTSSRVSLNQNMMIGPTIQSELYQTLLRFRLHQIAFCADVKMMYRQILLHKDHQNFHRIFWRSSTDKPIQEYRLKTVTYGTSAAPFLAIRVLNQLAEDEKLNFPLASPILKKDFYVDDLISGAPSVSEALKIQNELLKICESAGFRLLKWSSNSEALLNNLPVEFRETQLPLFLDSEEEGVKSLGIQWNPSSDQFSFKVNLHSETLKISKRTILSEIAKLFDPLGWLAPTIILAKIFMQKLWLLNLQWDQDLPEEVTSSWLDFKYQLPELEKIRIPRCIIINGSSIKYELNGFADSSEIAYGAIVYICSSDENEERKVHMLTSKTRVAPLKTISLPRLELCAAVLLSKLLKKVQATLELDFEKIFAYTDSTIVLSWIRKPARNWNTFDANRVNEIQEIISPQHWYHVPTQENPADVCSRGLLPNQLLTSSIWWNGPNFIISQEYPTQTTFDDPSAINEQRKAKVSILTSTTTNLDLIGKYSSLNKLQRTTAWILRFVNNCKLASKDRIYGHLNTLELKNALQFWIKKVQEVSFSKELESLRKNEQLKKTSKILTLSPFIDKTGLLRVGGRLKNLSKLNVDKKHPILLPNDNILTNMIVQNEHIKLLHGGTQLLQAALQQRFWIINSKRIISSIIHKCITCYRQKASVSTQKMGDLPIHRLEPARPFIRSGLDYGGPFTIKLSTGRGAKTSKAYICLFVCMSTKAIHLELASDLSTESFILCLKRFVSRRGLCSDIYSDNGTNFVGADNELKTLRNFTRSDNYNEVTSSYLTNKGINWHFIPPNAPHFGGLWESGIKSTKKHLIRVIGNATLTYEEFSTLLTQVEACLNSRPICSISSDADDLQALTPGHLLIGDSLTAIPEPGLTHLKINRLSRFQHVQQILQHFWKRWSTEYVTQLQQRRKWKTATDGIKIGDLVLVKEESAPLTWKMARVLELHPGKDNLTRVVTIKTEKGDFKRPISKLCVLPINDQLNQVVQGAEHVQL